VSQCDSVSGPVAPVWGEFVDASRQDRPEIRNRKESPFHPQTRITSGANRYFRSFNAVHLQPDAIDSILCPLDDDVGQGNPTLAEESLRMAVRADPSWLHSRANLAALQSSCPSAAVPQQMPDGE
jgi:hypothetical protein